MINFIVRLFDKKIVSIFVILILMLPIMLYLLSDIKIKRCVSGVIEKDDPSNTYILNNYNWNDGHYFMTSRMNPNININDNKEYYIVDNTKIIYIRNILGNNFENLLSDSIVIRNKFLPGNHFSGYKITGNLISTTQRFNDSPVFDLYVETWDKLSGIERDGLYMLTCPDYCLTIVDFKMFSNFIYDFILISIIAVFIYIMFLGFFKFMHVNSNTYMYYFILGFFATFISTMIFITIARYILITYII